MAINYELLNKGGISLGTNFELLSEKPLDSRLVVPSLSGLQNYIDNAAAYEGMIVFDQTTKKTYQVQTINGVLSYREFGINEDELKKLIAAETTAAMEFKGAATALPENPAKGDMYKVTEPFKVGEADTKVGDSIVYDGTQWFIIPSGDDIEDTWRPVTGVNNDASLTFADGEKTVAAVAENGTIKINHAKIEGPADVTAEGDEKTRTYLTAVVTDDYGHITGYKTATEKVEDTNTEYTFESQVESSNVYFNVTPDTEGATKQTIYVDAYSKNEADNKFVAKEEGKSLISDDEIARLTTLKNYDDTQVKADIAKKADAEAMATELGKKVDKVEGKDLIATSEIERLTTLKNYDDTALAGRVTTAENKITSLETESAKHALKTEVEAVDAKFADYTKTADLPTDLGDFTNDAGYAKTADVSTELNKKADKTQVATDIANAVEPLATKTELNGVKDTAEKAAVKTWVDDELAKKADKSVVDGMYTNAKIDELIAGAKTYADGLITDANLDQYTTEQEVKDIVDGVIASAADDETYNSLTKLVDYIDEHGGEAAEMATAISALEGRVGTIEGKPAYGITAGDIKNWNDEIGAKALAESKTTAEEVKTLIEAYGYATEGYADGKASAAESAAKGYADTELAKKVDKTAFETFKGENTTAIGTAKTEAIADAKSETERQVGALAATVYTKTEVDALLTWGEF